MVGSVSVLWAIALVGCGTCTPERSIPPSTAHFSEWSPLVGAAVRGDRDAARVMARDLALGDVPEGDGADAVGAALGFLQVANADELVDAVVEAGEGCASCHAQAGVLAPPAPSGPHARIANAAVARALAFDVEADAGEGVRGTAEAALATCTGCHAPTGTPGSP